jgi:flagellar hook-basal body protein
MDVEGNNIANVNTVGFKYSRANFADMLAQTSKIASAPEGGLGGTNAVQVGLGSNVASVSKIFSQGSLEKTDKSTDVAIQGEGFFVVSADNGKSYKYTRSGDFSFDANGMLVDGNGYVLQGWLMDDETNNIDLSSTPQSIQVDSALTMPPSPTGEIIVDANLNSGDVNNKTKAIFQTDENGAFVGATGNEVAEDLAMLFNDEGDSFGLQAGDSFQVSINGAAVQEYSYGIDFTTTEDLRVTLANATGLPVTINEFGKFEISNTTGAPVAIEITEGNKNNANLFGMLSSLSTKNLLSGSTSVSGGMSAAYHTTSVDVIDSLGSKHTLTFDFRKVENDKWSLTVETPVPGSIEGSPEANILRGGTVSFNPDGSLQSVNPTTLKFTANNGSAENQIINIDFGSMDGFDGLTSFENDTATSGISQNGYGSGSLADVAIDPSGVITGTFSNGKSIPLAQFAMATFTNNEGLMSEGGNIYVESANSGSALIGQAGVGSRGDIQASYLEMSNVDLSRSLTKLIVVQRGFQANSKTITTSDQMLNTLLQLKT